MDMAEHTAAAHRMLERAMSRTRKVAVERKEREDQEAAEFQGDDAPLVKLGQGDFERTYPDRAK